MSSQMPAFLFFVFSVCRYLELPSNPHAGPYATTPYCTSSQVKCIQLSPSYAFTFPAAALDFSAVTWSSELTSRKWYSIMRSMAALPRKMASVYNWLSVIILALTARRWDRGKS
ncbi:hypothetical protein BU26DRAFT_512821 [Trematosphaeria pertusa]|uniref:Secreted protein n=1 Tax=Trematosphaeria pertusa TaxID=390896 RepID=A0A6A6IZJ8_9PLEO|nr:uncharacterized protein BU26DRAFT_512821 [Trematosphaeria pertusa]KAF2255869.1 hypothetical protein BU26DRAFT_512821 [Trematosphaeria pertusa]